MIVYDALEDVRTQRERPFVATLGNFDGLHRGHAEIIRRLIDDARRRGGRSLVVTFSPHPLRVLAPERAPRLMMTRQQKIDRLEAMGVDAVLFLPFDRSLAEVSAEEFVRSILSQRLRIASVFVGPDFRFGRGRRGDIDLLSTLGRELGFDAAAVPAVEDGGARISASRIRDELAAGRVEEAARLLGRPFALAGTVVHGAGRGRTHLVPTANLAPENEFLPRGGVYITRMRGDRFASEGLTNVGTRPTFGESRLVVETHLPGFEGDLYGRRVELDFLARLRDERRFDDPQALRRQIARDREAFEAWRSRR